MGVALRTSCRIPCLTVPVDTEELFPADFQLGEGGLVGCASSRWQVQITPELSQLIELSAH